MSQVVSKFTRFLRVQVWWAFARLCLARLTNEFVSVRIKFIFVCCANLKLYDPFFPNPSSIKEKFYSYVSLLTWKISVTKCLYHHGTLFPYPSSLPFPYFILQYSSPGLLKANARPFIDKHFQKIHIYRRGLSLVGRDGYWGSKILDSIMQYQLFRVTFFIDNYMRTWVRHLFD